MFVRQKIWQNAIIESQSQSGWENLIVLAYPSVDIRFKLKGYGWKPSSDITNLTILYEGRYDCYYRERGTIEWLHFATIISERASYESPKVYEDIISLLGLVQSKIYEIKIIASDAEKFKGWGGVIEGIAENKRFYYNLQFRADRPLGIQLFESIFLGEYSYGGLQVFGFGVSDDILLSEVLISNLIYLVGAIDEVTVVLDIFEISLNLGLSDRFEELSVFEYIEILLI